jgi:hypothetical protein
MQLFSNQSQSTSIFRSLKFPPSPTKPTSALTSKRSPGTSFLTRSGHTHIFGRIQSISSVESTSSSHIERVDITNSRRSPFLRLYSKPKTQAASSWPTLETIPGSPSPYVLIRIPLPLPAIPLPLAAIARAIVTALRLPVPSPSQVPCLRWRSRSLPKH